MEEKKKNHERILFLKLLLTLTFWKSLLNLAYIMYSLSANVESNKYILIYKVLFIFLDKLRLLGVIKQKASSAPRTDP